MIRWCLSEIRPTANLNLEIQYGFCGITLDLPLFEKFVRSSSRTYWNYVVNWAEFRRDVTTLTPSFQWVWDNFAINIARHLGGRGAPDRTYKSRIYMVVWIYNSWLASSIATRTQTNSVEKSLLWLWRNSMVKPKGAWW